MSRHACERTWRAALAACALVWTALSAPAADVTYTWKDPVSGTYSDGGRWNPAGPPPADDWAYFTQAGDYTVTFTGNAAADRAYLEPTGTITLDLGGYTWTVGPDSQLFRVQTVSGGTLAITNGTVDSSSGLNSRVGYNAANQTVLITNGGTWRVADFYIGNAAADTNNAVVVAGAGSRFEATGQVRLNQGLNTRLVVTDGASARFGSNTIVGVNAACTGHLFLVSGGATVTNIGTLLVGSPVGSQANAVRVDNASLELTGQVTVGNNGTESLFEIVNGGTVANTAKFLVGNGANGVRNTLRVDGAGSSLTCAGIDLGWTTGTYSEHVVVTNGGLLTLTAGMNLGYKGNSNMVVITGTGSRMDGVGITYGSLGGFNNTLIVEDGAVLNLSGSTELGYNGASSNDMLIVRSGGAFTNGGSLTTGRGGTNAMVLVDAGHIHVGGTLNIGFVDGALATMIVTNSGTVTAVGVVNLAGNNAGASNATLYVTGPGSRVESGVGQLFRVANAARECRVFVENGGTIVGSGLTLGGTVTASNALLSIAGGTVYGTNSAGDAATVIRYGGTLRVNGSGGAIRLNKANFTIGGGMEFNLDENGVTPVELTGALTLDVAGSTWLTVDAMEYAAEGGGTVTLVDYGTIVNTNSMGAITVNPPECTVNLADDGKITIGVPDLSGPAGSVFVVH